MASQLLPVGPEARAKKHVRPPPHGFYGSHGPFHRPVRGVRVISTADARRTLRERVCCLHTSKRADRGAGLMHRTLADPAARATSRHLFRRARRRGVAQETRPAYWLRCGTAQRLSGSCTPLAGKAGCSAAGSPGSFFASGDFIFYVIPDGGERDARCQDVRRLAFCVNNGATSAKALNLSQLCPLHRMHLLM